MALSKTPILIAENTYALDLPNGKAEINEGT